MNHMLVLSASHPKNAEPMPPRPNMRPKKTPEIIPILSGIRSVAYTTIDENADEITRPMMTDRTMVQKQFTWGSSRAKGAAPKMEPHIMYFLPYLSPKSPPPTVPSAYAARNAKRHSWEFCTVIENLSIRKNVK